MITISPSILSCDFLNIETELKAFDKIKGMWFHLDIMDGHFVPNLTFGHPLAKLIRNVTSQPLDAHFMVKNPEFYIDTFKDFGIHNFTFHVEATMGHDELIKLIEKAKTLYPSVGISIKPKTPVSGIPDKAFDLIDLLLVMSVEPGFGGQSFIEGTWDKLNHIKELKKTKDLDFQVQIDGGVNDKNAKKLIEHGVNNLVAGSYIFKAEPKNYNTQIESLRK
ncbi:MAG: ribulose-phosphate 3-epimerase [Bacteriovoracaceae bacterium]|nr:ribulose-phosphate 3-epimerase [Bacteriovoracaceae bacterium]